MDANDRKSAEQSNYHVAYLALNKLPKNQFHQLNFLRLAHHTFALFRLENDFFGYVFVGVCKSPSPKCEVHSWWKN